MRRIAVGTIALFIFGILSIFPNEIQESLPNEVSIFSTHSSSIYLIDPYGYVGRVEMAMKNQDVINQAREIVESLVIDGNKSTYLPNGFHAVLPKGTTLLHLDIQNHILKLDFNDNFSKIPAQQEERVLESLIFSLTELDDIQGILLYIQGELLTRLPNSQIPLPSILTREYGINKIYNLTEVKNTVKTTAYYVSKYQNVLYYVPVTEIRNDSKEKVEIVIERLKSSPIYQTNLMSYLSANAELLDYEILENDIQLSFNHYLLDDFQNKHILEEVEYSIGLSLRDTIDISKVSFLIDGELLKETEV